MRMSKFLGGFLGIALCGSALAQGINNPLQSGILENRIINGDFLIDQRFAGASNTPVSGTFPIDGNWRAITSIVGTFADRQVAGFAGFANAMQLTSLTNATIVAGTNIYISPRLEGSAVADFAWGTAAAKNVMLTFWVKSSLTGTFCATLLNPAGAQSYVGTYSIPVANTATYVAMNIVGNTTGVWPTAANTMGLQVLFMLGTGSTFESATVNQWQTATKFCTSGAIGITATSGATLTITNVRLRVGNYDVPYAPRPYADEMALAQRFFLKTFPQATAPTQNAGINGALSMRNPIAIGQPSVYWAFPVPIANGGSLTVTTYNPSAGNANWRDVTAAADVAVSVDPAATATSASAGEQTGVLITTGATVTTLADVLAIHATVQGGF